jgi:hypothetical protein
MLVIWLVLFSVYDALAGVGTGELIMHAAGKACREYDEGAACYTRAARIGIPVTSIATREVEQNIDCGFASSEKGGRPLAEAQLKAIEIKTSIR